MVLPYWRSDEERNENRVPRDDRQRDWEIAIQVVYVVRRRLLLVMETSPPCTIERQQWSTQLFQISLFLACSANECCFGTFVYSYQLVQKRSNKSKAESGLYGPQSRSSYDLLLNQRVYLDRGKVVLYRGACLPNHFL